MKRRGVVLAGSVVSPAAADCGPGAACEMPRVNRAGKVALWIAAVVVMLATTFPLYSVYLS